MDMSELHFLNVNEHSTKQMGLLFDSLTVDISNNEYHSEKSSTSCSQLKAILRSQAHFRESLSKRRIESTLPQNIGTALHTAVLEPLLLKDTVEVWKGGTRKGIIWEKFKYENQAKIILSREEYDSVIDMRDAVYDFNVPETNGLCLGEIISMGESEKSIFWTDKETGIRCKVRIDNLLAPRVAFDLKSCGDARPDEFIRFQALKNDFDLQSAMYSEGVHALTGEWLPFCFITVETEKPHGVWLHETSKGTEFFENGMRKFRYALRALKEARDTNKWQNYTNNYSVLDSIPNYSRFVAPDGK